jgi:hypothetical protein
MRTLRLRRSPLVFASALTLSLCSLSLHAQTSAVPAGAVNAPKSGPPVRRIESAVAVSTEPLGAISGIRALPNGRVILNDGSRRRLLMLDSSLKVTAVLLDSVTEVRNAYGAGPGTLLSYRSDSSMFIDPQTLAMLVLDGSGKVARVRSVPRAENASRMSQGGGGGGGRGGGGGGNAGLPAFDSQGRLVYRINAQANFPNPRPPKGVPYFRVPPDSAFIVGIELDSRKIDTLGTVRVQPQFVAVRRNANGTFNTTNVTNPLPLVDDWAVLSDGTLAFVRGRDYRVEWLQPDGSLKSSEKLPFPWVQITLEDKERMVDSMRAVQARNAQLVYTMELVFWTYMTGRPYPEGFTPPAGVALPAGLPRDLALPKGLEFPKNYVFGCSIALTGRPVPPRTVPADSSCVQNPFESQMIKGYQPPPPTYRVPNVIPPSELPDYRPPFNASSTVADADGNLWVRTNPMQPRIGGGPIFDVISRAGLLVDRIELPPGYSIAGFGAGRVVYLSMRDARGLHLAKVRLR